MNLSKKDYQKILSYYQLPIPGSTSILKNNAHTVLAEKLCRCIKKVDPTNETKSIGICSKNIFNRKGYTRGTFRCKGKATVSFRKSSRTKTMNLRKNRRTLRKDSGKNKKR